MMEYLFVNWIGIATLVIAVIGVLVSAGFFVRHKRDVKDLIYVEQERDDLRRKLAAAEVRLDHVDPERFIDRAADLYAKGAFDKVDALAFKFAERQQEAFGKAAEYLTEQNILDSETHPQAIQDAQKFAAIGQAAFPESKRLIELANLADRRARDIANGDPIEALNLDGLSALDLHNLSAALLKDGKYSLAELAARRAVPKLGQQHGLKAQPYAAGLNQHARCLESLGAYLEAEGLYREALEIGRATIGEAHPAYATHLNNLASVVEDQGRLEEAEGLFRDALEIDRATIGEGHPAYAIDLNNLASVVEDQGRLEEAEGLYREALAIGRATIGEAHPDYATHLNNLAGLLRGQGKPEEARPLWEKALTIRRATLPDDHPYIAQVERDLASLPPASAAD